MENKFSRLALPVWCFEKSVLVNKLTFDLCKIYRKYVTLGISNTTENLIGQNALKKDEECVR